MAEADNGQENAQPGKRQAPKRTAKKAATRKNSKKVAGKKAEKKATDQKASEKKAAVKKATRKKAGSKKATRKAAQVKPDAKVTKKTADKHAAQQSAAQGAATSTNSQQAGTFDRSVLVDKMRVHLLAKLIGITSRELTSVLREMGLKKVAQSTLTLEESNAVLDRLEAQNASQEQESAPAEGHSEDATPADESAEEDTRADSSEPTVADEPAAEESPDSAEQEAAEPHSAEQGAAEREALDKLKYRVGKNVENEIHQIEQKVDRQLEELQHEAEERKVEDRDADEQEDARGGAPQQEEKQQDTDQPEEGNSEDVEDDGFTDLDEEAFEDSRSAYDHNLDVAEAIADAPLFLAPQDSSEQYDAEGSYSYSSQQEDSEDDDLQEVGSQHSAQKSDTVEEEPSRRRRRGRRGTRRGRGPDNRKSSARKKSEGSGRGDDVVSDEPVTEPVAIKGSTRLEAQRRRRSEMRQKGRQNRHLVSQAEFLARRESVERIMVVRERQRHDHAGRVTQVGVLEDGVLVEHFVTNEDQSSMIGNIYLGRVQNVLPSMEAAFIDIGTGRNGVLYSGEVDWKSAGLDGRGRRIEQALHPGDQVLVQATKDPIGHKGARLTTQISLPGRYLVYVPGGRSSGISRKLPVPERKRLKEILKHVMPEDGGAIIRTAAEGVSEEAIAADVERLHKLWEDINSKSQSSRKSKPVTLYEEPNVLVKVIRDLFNEDFHKLIVDGEKSWNIVRAYVESVAPDLVDRLEKWDRSEHDGADVFEFHKINDQLQKALSRKVWLPSGGTLIIDRTEAMTVIDVNTGRFTGSGGNLEETVTATNIEAAEEIVRQLRLRDIGGMVVIDFIDMVLPENQDLVVRRLTEALGRDRTRHQVSEVTSLGLVQLTRKRLGTGLLETFTTECEECNGRGVIIHDDPVEDTTRHEKHQNKARRPEHPADHPLFEALKRHRKSNEELADAVLGDLAGEASEDAEPQTPAVTEDMDTEEADRKRSPRRVRTRRSHRSVTSEDHPAPSQESVPAGKSDSSEPQEREDKESESISVPSLRRGRRRVRRVMSAQQVAQKARSQQLSEDEESAPRPVCRGSRRRIRRAVRRTSTKAGSSATVRAGHRAHRASHGSSDSLQEDERTQSRHRRSDDPRAAEQRYAKEKAAFDASPRRRRRVRGNSKSDIPPQPPRSRRR